MDPITSIILSIILGALGNALYGAVIGTAKLTSRQSKLQKLLSERHWARLYNQDNLGKLVEKHRAGGSLDALMEIGQTLEVVLRKEQALAS